MYVHMIWLGLCLMVSKTASVIVVLVVLIFIAVIILPHCSRILGGPLVQEHKFRIFCEFETLIFSEVILSSGLLCDVVNCLVHRNVYTTAIVPVCAKFLKFFCNWNVLVQGFCPCCIHALTLCYLQGSTNEFWLAWRVVLLCVLQMCSERLVLFLLYT